jgi:hypothetical protein
VADVPGCELPRAYRTAASSAAPRSSSLTASEYPTLVQSGVTEADDQPMDRRQSSDRKPESEVNFCSRTATAAHNYDTVRPRLGAPIASPPPAAKAPNGLPPLRCDNCPRFGQFFWQRPNAYLVRGCSLRSASNPRTAVFFLGDQQQKGAPKDRRNGQAAPTCLTEGSQTTRHLTHVFVRVKLSLKPIWRNWEVFSENPAILIAFSARPNSLRFRNARLTRQRLRTARIQKTCIFGAFPTTGSTGRPIRGP